MIFAPSANDEKKRQLANCLAQIVNCITEMQRRPMTWDQRIEQIQKIQKAMPAVIRYMIYFKNTEGG